MEIEQYRLKNQSVKMQKIISNKETMLYPIAVHKTVTDLGWTGRKKITAIYRKWGLIFNNRDSK